MTPDFRPIECSTESSGLYCVALKSRARSCNASAPSWDRISVATAAV